MAKKRPSSEQIQAMLQESHFGAGRELPTADPVTATQLVVEIGRIQPYERNPRHGRNPEYDRIKASIRAHGMDQPLVITQRPGEADYIVHTGGNTRLRILQELYEETGDEQFYRIHCLMRPWTRESDVLLAHLRENDLRGSLTFIDKARAVFEVKRLIEEESGIGELSHRSLETELRAAGYSISCGRISRMRYAVQTLLPLIPQALEVGMGKPQVERIRALERAARNLWQRYCTGGDSAFDAVFAALCRRYDGPDWDTNILQGAIETEIAEEADTSIHTIRVALDAELDGREVVLPEVEPVPEPSGSVRHSVEIDDTDASEDRDDQEGTEAGLVPTNVESTEPSGYDPVEELNQTQDHSDDHATDIKEPLADRLITTGQAGPGDLKSLRGRAWTLAARLAQRNGIGDLVMPVSGKGLGFVLRDVPDPVLAEQLDDESLGQVSMLWWQLAACAEMTFAPLESIVPTLPGDSVLRRALEDQDAGLLFKSVWTLDPGHTGYRLWRSLHDQDWSDLINLMDTYRRIRHLAAETGTAIWD